MIKERRIASQIRNTALSCCLLLAGTAAWPETLPAQTAQSSAFAASSAEQRVFDRRLKLTPAQKKAMAPIMRASIRARQAAMRKHGIDLDSGVKPGLFKLLALRSDMLAVSRWTRAQLAPILSAEQMREYERIAAEQKEHMKQRLMGR